MASAEFSINPPFAASGATLQRKLGRLAARRNLLLLLNELAKSLTVGLFLAALTVVAYKFYLVDGAWWMPTAIIVLTALIGLRNGLGRQGGSFDAAQDADQILSLNDRLASALAFVDPSAIRHRGQKAKASGFLPRLRSLFLPQPVFVQSMAATPTSLVPALVNEASTHARSLRPHEVYPLKFGGPQKWFSAAAVALTAALFMPDMPQLLSVEQRADVKTSLPQTGKKLQLIAKEVHDNKDIKNPETKKLAKKLAALGKRMERARMAKKDAMLEMAQLREKVSEAARKNPVQPFSSQLEKQMEALGQQKMESAEGRKMQEHLKKGELDKAAKEIEKLADKLDKGNLSNAEKEKAARDLEKAAKALRQQGGPQNQAMADKLDQAAKALREQNQQQKNAQGGQKDQQKQAGQKGEQSGKDGQGKQAQNGKKPGEQPGKSGEQAAKDGGKQPGAQRQASNQQGEKSGLPSGGQQGQKSGNKQGGGQKQSGQDGKSGSQSGGQKSVSGGSEALRKMAQGMRGSGSGMGQGQGNSNSESLQRMLSQIQEAERQCGSGQGGQSGNGGNSGNDNQDMTPGKDLKPTDPTQAGGGGAGLGRRDHIRGFNNKGGGLSNQHAKRTGDKRRWADVWAPKLPGTQKKISQIRGHLGKGEMETLQTEGDPTGGPVKTPYYDVYETYKKDADSAVGKEVVPPAYRQPVKDYFDSIKPGR